MDTLQERALAKTLRQDPPPVDRRTGKRDRRVMIAVVPIALNQNVHGTIVRREINEDGSLSDEPVIVEAWESHVSAFEGLVEDASPSQMKQVRADFGYHDENREKHDEHRRHWSPSLAASFRAVMKRDMRPFKSVEVLGYLGPDGLEDGASEG